MCVSENSRNWEGALNCLSRDYRLVEKERDDRIDPKDRSPKSYLNVLQEYGYCLNGLPLQGGQPSLGKVR